jgi:hypothetical protein
MPNSEEPIKITSVVHVALALIDGKPAADVTSRFAEQGGLAGDVFRRHFQLNRP